MKLDQSPMCGWHLEPYAKLIKNSLCKLQMLTARTDDTAAVCQVLKHLNYHLKQPGPEFW